MIWLEVILSSFQICMRTAIIFTLIPRINKNYSDRNINFECYLEHYAPLSVYIQRDRPLLLAQQQPSAWNIRRRNINKTPDSTCHFNADRVRPRSGEAFERNCSIAVAASPLESL